MNINNTIDETYRELFTEKAQHYDRYRPRYSNDLFKDLIRRGLLKPGFTIADIGCGTGILSAQLIDEGCTVFGVEPNTEMRKNIPSSLLDNERFMIKTGSAESTTLDDKSVDLVSAGQAFHWFDAGSFRNECRRILKDSSDGKVLLVWNRKQAGPMESERKSIVEKYRRILDTYSCSWDDREEGIKAFFEGDYESAEYDNPIVNDYGEFIERTLSASHAISDDDPRFREYLDAWTAYFKKHKRADDKIEIPNKTVAYWGSI